MDAGADVTRAVAWRDGAARIAPWLGLLVLGLAASFGMLRGGAYGAIGISGGLLLYAVVALAEGRTARLDAAVAAFVLVLLALAALLNLQAAFPAAAWHETGQLATILLPLLLLACPAMQKRLAVPAVLRFWPWLLLLGAVALTVALWRLHGAAVPDEYRLTKYNRGLSYGLLLCWPVMALLARRGRRGWAVALFLALLPALYLTHSRATQVAALLAVLVWGAARVMPVATRWGLGLALVLALGWPFWAQAVFSHDRAWAQGLPDSWAARMEIWDFMAYRIMERPWLGWGIGGSPMLSPALPHGEWYRFTHAAVAHPHNAMTQLWVELGLFGLALGAGFALLMLRRAGRMAQDVAPFALAGWAASLALGLVAYDLWTDSLLAAFALTALGFAVVARVEGSKNKPLEE